MGGLLAVSSAGYDVAHWFVFLPLLDLTDPATVPFVSTPGAALAGLLPAHGALWGPPHQLLHLVQVRGGGPLLGR